MRIAIFGGSFDPVHYGHLILAEYARKAFKLDSIYFIPCYQSAYKNKIIQASDEDRMNMLHLAINYTKGDVLCDHEVNKKGISYTIDTINFYREQHKKDTIYFIAGKDSINKFSSWKNHKEIKKFIKFASKDFYVPDIKICSTLIRELRKNNNSITYLVPKAVEDYIIRNNLYRGN